MATSILLLIVMVASVWLFYWSMMAEKDPKENIKKFPFAPRYTESNVDDEESNSESSKLP